MRAKRPLRIVVLGAPKVGKTAITVRYLTQRFIGEYSSRGDVIYRHNVNIGGEKAEMEILDTCKSSISHREGDGYLVVFSVTEPSSLAAAAGILAGLPAARPVLLLGNKTDLDHARCVSVRAGLELSVLAGCPYLEVSAASGDRAGIALAFGALASRARPQSPLRAAIRALTALLTPRKPPAICSAGNRLRWKCVSVRAGLELSVLAGCPYLEVSAASGDRAGIALAFGALASRARPQSPLRAAIRALTALLTPRKPPAICSAGNRLRWK